MICVLCESNPVTSGPCRSYAGQRYCDRCLEDCGIDPHLPPPLTARDAPPGSGSGNVGAGAQ